MTRLGKTDLNEKVDHIQGADAPVQDQPQAVRESMIRQANKGMLSEAVARELDVPRRTAARFLDAVLDSIQDLLRTRGKVAIKRFGTLECKVRKGRAYKHPVTGKSIDVADKATVLFKPSDNLTTSTKTGSPPRRSRSKSKGQDDILLQG